VPMREIGTRFKLEGEQAFKSAMKDAASAIKVLNAEQKLAKAQFEETGDAQQYAADQARILKEQIEQQKKAVEAAENAVKKLTENGVDKNSEQMQKWRTKLINAKTTLTQMQTRLDKVQTELGEEGQAFNETEQDANQYQQTMEGVNKGIDFQNTIQAIDNITGHIETVIKAAGRAVNALWTLGKDAGAWADDIATKANEAGVEPEVYQSWLYASSQIDTSVEDIVRSWQDIDKKLKQTGEAYYEYAGDLTEVGIATQKVGGEMRQGSEIFWDAIDYLHGITDSSKLAAEATKLFGNDWRKLNPLITNGTAAYKELAEKGRVVAAVSNEDIAKLGGIDDTIQDLQFRINKLKMDALAELAPFFTETATAMAEAVTAFDEFVQSAEGQAALESLNDALSGIIDSFLGEDNGKGTFQAIIEGAAEGVRKFTGAMQWISKNGKVIVGIVSGMAIAWAGLKTTKEILMFMQLLKATPLNKLTAIFSPGKAAAEGAAGAASAAGAAGAKASPIIPPSWTSKLGSFLTSSAAKVAGAAGIFLSTLLTPKNTATQEQDQLYHDDGTLTEAGKEAEQRNWQQERQQAEALLELTEKQRKTAEKYWDAVRAGDDARNQSILTWDELIDGFEGDTEKLLETLDLIDDRMKFHEQTNTTPGENMPDSWFGDAQKAAEKITFTFAEAPKELAQEAAAAVEEIEKAAVQLTDEEQKQRDAAEAYWDAMRESPNGWTEEAAKAWNTFQEAFDGNYEAFENVNDQIDQLIADAGDGWQKIEDLPEDWFASGSAAATALGDALTEGADTAAEASAAVADAVEDEAATLQRDMGIDGENAAVGLANGIDRRAGEAVRAARYMAGAVANIVRSTLMIHSPSKVMEGLGEYTGEGFAQGIENSASTVDRAVGRMISATTRRPVMSIAGVAMGRIPAAAAAPAPGSAAHSAPADTVHVTLMLDDEVLGDVMAPIVNEKIGAKIQSTRR